MKFSEAYTRSGEWQLVHCPVLVNSNERDPLYQDITFYFIIRKSSISVAPSSALDDGFGDYDGGNFPCTVAIKLIIRQLLESDYKTGHRVDSQLVTEVTRLSVEIIAQVYEWSFCHLTLILTHELSWKDANLYFTWSIYWFHVFLFLHWQFLPSCYPVPPIKRFKCQFQFCWVSQERLQVQNKLV